MWIALFVCSFLFLFMGRYYYRQSIKNLLLSDKVLGLYKKI